MAFLSTRNFSRYLISVKIVPSHYFSAGTDLGMSYGTPNVTS